jgi:hypothetical protein
MSSVEERKGRKNGEKDRMKEVERGTTGTTR